MEALGWIAFVITVIIWLIPTFAAMTKTDESCKPQDEDKD